MGPDGDRHLRRAGLTVIAARIEIVFDRTPGASARVRAGAKDVDRKAAMQVYAYSQPMTPVDTGALKSNVTVGPDFVHWHQEYSLFVELGTRKMAPRLFATTAVNRVRPDW
ncbi:MAG: hypothetical protein ACR2OO_04045, partial [Thermomicrobiales bacterium]